MWSQHKEQSASSAAHFNWGGGRTSVAAHWIKCFPCNRSLAHVIRNLPPFVCVCDTNIVCWHATHRCSLILRAMQWVTVLHFVSPSINRSQTPFNVLTVGRSSQRARSLGAADVKPPGSDCGRLFKCIELVHKTKQRQCWGPPNIEGQLWTSGTFRLSVLLSCHGLHTFHWEDVLTFTNQNKPAKTKCRLHVNGASFLAFKNVLLQCLDWLYTTTSQL